MDYKNKTSLKMINILKFISNIKLTNSIIIFIYSKKPIFILIEIGFFICHNARI